QVFTYHVAHQAGTGLDGVGALLPAALAWSDDGGALYRVAKAAAGGDQVAGAIERAPAGAPVGANPGFTRLRGSRPGDTSPVTCGCDRRLAFVRVAAAKPQLWLMNGDGTGVRQLTFATYYPVDGLLEGGVAQPVWVPGP